MLFPRIVFLFILLVWVDALPSITPSSISSSASSYSIYKRDTRSNANAGATSIDAKDNELIGKVIKNKYRIESLVGTGSFGEVYSAVNVKTQQKVAIKMTKVWKNIKWAFSEWRLNRKLKSLDPTNTKYITILLFLTFFTINWFLRNFSLPVLLIMDFSLSFLLII
jgi:serine/threonine protein kinase